MKKKGLWRCEPCKMSGVWRGISTNASEPKVWYPKCSKCGRITSGQISRDESSKKTKRTSKEQDTNFASAPMVTESSGGASSGKNGKSTTTKSKTSPTSPNSHKERPKEASLSIEKTEDEASGGASSAKKGNSAMTKNKASPKAPRSSKRRPEEAGLSKSNIQNKCSGRASSAKKGKSTTTTTKSKKSQKAPESRKEKPEAASESIEKTDEVDPSSSGDNNITRPNDALDNSSDDEQEDNPELAEGKEPEKVINEVYE